MKSDKPRKSGKLQKVRVRRLKLGDYASVTQLQLKCFPGMENWSREQFKSLIQTFPAGQLCIESNGILVSSSCSLVIEIDEYSDTHHWEDITDHGKISNHDAEGDTLYGIEIMVDPKYRGMRLSRRLYDARKKLCLQLNLKRIVIGGRIPGYHLQKERMTPREYVDKVVSRSLQDPVLTPQLANGFVLKRLISGYLAADKESDGQATLMEWINLDYQPRPTGTTKKTDPVRLGVVQYQVRTIASFDEFARQCEYFVDVAAGYRCDFALFPEIFTTQLLSMLDIKDPAESARSLNRFTEAYLDLFTHLAVKYNVNIVGGTHLTIEGDNLFNIAYLFRRDGSTDKQYKLHVTPSERHWWGVQAGDELKVFDTDRGKISIQICYDIEFPELSRLAVEQGARIIFVPFCTDMREGYVRVRSCAQARCIENQVYTALAGVVGNLPFVSNMDIHYAQSGIFCPSDLGFARDGIVAECTPNIETLVVQDVDIAALERARAHGTVTNWKDRRQDLYKTQWLAKPKK